MTGPTPRVRKRTDNKSNMWTAAAVTLLLVVLVTGAISIFASRALNTATTTTPIEGETSNCPQSSAPPIAVPDGGPTHWEVITVANGLPIPKNPDYGPHVTTGIPHCYNSGTAGALFQAANFATWYLSGADLLNALDTLAWPDIARQGWEDEILEKCGADLAKCPTEPELPDIVAYAGNQHSATRVDVDLVYDRQPGSGQWIVLRIPMQWDGQDWRVLMPAAGPLPTNWVTSLDEFTPWRIN